MKAKAGVLKLCSKHFDVITHCCAPTRFSRIQFDAFVILINCVVILKTKH